MNNSNDAKRNFVLAAGLASISLMTGCNKTEKQWENSPGTKGFINLDDVAETFKRNRDMISFQNRVNEIFEGDNLVVFKVDKTNSGFVMNASEDLNQDKAFSSGDDPLFVLTLKKHTNKSTVTLKGLGVNRYYSKTWTYDEKREKAYYNSYYHGHHHHGLAFFYWFGPGRRSWSGYHTTRKDYTTAANNRNNYRKSSEFKSQIKRNNSFDSSMSRKNGNRFVAAAAGTTMLRNSYIKSKKSSPSFKNNLASSKSTSAWGARAGSASLAGSSFSKGTRSFGSSSSGSRSYGRSGFGRASGFGV
jgi:hypothetical protein